ncbi:hypothetical protein [Neorhodopirellula pilleata]|uniref:Uncharacterized protein n=1 Tax=Neorhodopirellula pilleata TaxID=2714738 RepID=A0A5C5ZYV4_9BACT|nr:hypothetical protein [Neorhodopirellula pilleata]TWT91483.1 hypothetical protein Pla100_53340 [Neorhodopirellula pilleata]
MGADSITEAPQQSVEGAEYIGAIDSPHATTGAQTGAGSQQTGSQAGGAGTQQVQGWQQAASPPCIRLSNQPADAGLILKKVAKVTTRVHRMARRIERFIIFSGGVRKGQNRSFGP